MTKAKILSIVLLIILVIGGGIYLKNSQNKLESEKWEDLDIKEISFQGNVVFVGSNSAIITTGMVEETSQGNMYVTQDRSVAFLPMVILVRNGQEFTVAAAQIVNQLKPGDTGVFYGSIDGERFIVGRIEI